MLAWTQMSNTESSPDLQPVAAASLLYRMTVAFPMWAGGILALYSIFLCKFSNLRLRLK
jgi:hypothetical protein